VTGNTATVTAGATLTAGMPVYKDTADANEHKAGDNDVAASAEIEGVTLNGASDGQPVEIQTDGTIAIGATVTIGETYVLSSTSGKIAPVGDLASDDYVTHIGVGVTTARIELNIKAFGVQVP